MKQLRLSLSVILGVLGTVLFPIITHADPLATTLPELIISEIKVKNDTTPGGYNEFIELYNASATSLNLNQFTIEYHNTPAPALTAEPVKKVVIADKLLLSDQTMVLAANQEQVLNSQESPFASLSDSGGLVRVKGMDGTVHDEVAWTSTSSLAVAPILFLPSSTTNRPKSFIRDTDVGGNPLLSDPTWQLLTSTPHADELQPVPVPEPEPELETEPTLEPAPEISVPVTPPVDSESAGDAEVTPQTTETPAVLPLQISELLPNPAPPASDSTDEYIELYNPNNEAVDLNGYKLQTGNSFGYSYTFIQGTLQPHEYRAFYVTETGTLLANSGSRARLLGPAGQIIYETEAYGEAKEGQTWAYVAGPLTSDWQWTTALTPNAPNVLALPLIKAAAVKSTSAKTAAKPKTAAKTASAKKTTATAKAKTPKATGTSALSESDDPEATVNSIHPGIVAGVGALALGYGLWEYRHDLRNRLYQFRRYRATRRAARLEA